MRKITQLDKCRTYLLLDALQNAPVNPITRDSCGNWTGYLRYAPASKTFVLDLFKYMRKGADPLGWSTEGNTRTLAILRMAKALHLDLPKDTKLY